MNEPLSRPQKLAPTAPRKPIEEDDAVERRTLRDYYIILRERVWLALPLALIVSLGLAYYQLHAIPMYRSVANLIFKPNDPLTKSALDPGARSSIVPRSMIDINDYVTILGSVKVRDMVTDAAKNSPEISKALQQPYLLSQPGVKPPDVSSLISPPSISASQTSMVINITVANRSGQGAQMLARLYVEQFIEYVKQNTQKETKDNIKFLEESKIELGQLADKSAQAAQAFEKEQGEISLDPSTNIQNSAVTAADSVRNAAASTLSLSQLQLDQVLDAKAKGQVLTDIPVIRGDALVQADQAALVEINLKLVQELAHLDENHPVVKDLRLQETKKKSDLAGHIEDVIANLRSNLEKLKSNLKAAQDDYAAKEKKLLDLRELLITYGTLKNQADTDRANLDKNNTMLSQLHNDVQMESVPIEALDPATPAPTPYEPDPTHIAKSAVGVFLLVFVCVAVGLSFLDDRIKSSWDVETFINSTLLSIIPDLGEFKNEDKYRLVLSGAQGAGVEPFLGLYSSVKIHSKLDFPKSILITSTVPGEGKTLVSCNLAGSFARHGRRTLLIDCDLRRPMLHRHFQSENLHGLIAWFDKGASFEGDLTTNPDLGIAPLGDNLWVLTSGGRSKSPTGLLESASFNQMMEQLRKQFDVVVIDSPPMGAVTDALLISEQADEIIYVCRFNRAARKHIRLYIKALRSGGNEILGIVLNGLSPRRIEYYSNYRYYRSYKKCYGA